MNGRNLGAIVAGVLFLASGYVVKMGQEADLMSVRILGVCIAVGVIVCVHKGYNPFRKVWIGPTYEEMAREAQELEDMLWNREDRHNRNLTAKEYDRSVKRERKLRKMMTEYRELNSSR
ncbi:hypothetical protein L0636_00365 [Halomonas janggokensis]|uniref:Uncharacterized protein n=1 Tax=Vreelandella janggokensis TaxID=370767 RepID=A0ABT4IRP5_9GAMM|nr:hypothetical protein [Halomonas janggokensis]MCZ0926340.1 hypothetical protein [Halomonas janggokensis]MCZ0928878.1 hypothetical protein [Halomonas janggokensis]